jgi:pimeloyl-ACP methyl ester carboxylesterase
MPRFPRLSQAFAAAGLMLPLVSMAQPVPATPASASSQAPAASGAAASAATPCPEGLPAATRCLTGQDTAGAYWWIAVPQPWSGVLVLHSHGGPELGPPKPERSAEDLKRWSIMVRAGHAWAGSTFRQGGVAVRAAAEDTERLRGLFTQLVGAPRRTVLHGQSWGASVAAKGAEMFPGSYDGVLLTSGVLAGGSTAYDFRLDLRVVYQALCNNHPKPDEPAYPLWQGLPAGSPLTRPELARRIDECTGIQRKPAERSAEQQQRLDTLLKQARVPERTLVAHLNWGTWHFQDIVQKRTGGANPFGNIGARYPGPPADLNDKVQRYKADPAAVARFAEDTDPNGRISVPVLTTHGIHDPTAFVEMDHSFRQTMERAGNGARLVQTFTDDTEHSYLSDPAYPALVDALLAWIDKGEKPTPEGIAQRCPAYEARFGKGCRFLPAYQPAPLESRVTPRQR